ncbi:hypothetical protein NM688_g9296 [Phlebia brevispora]|uniref:Uncharacterized protein n=1 Tax=Phlebia brevispora TaxID=194682 RepID=A0ACC1RLF6_9APHY|nr:hypothetical protein NM688_g9296 [Phlebia brevispora]
MAPRRKSRIALWYDKLANFNVESLFSRKREPGPPRSVFVNEELPPDYFDQKQRVKKEYVYSTNQVITSKYTIVTFVPRNLLEQFRRVANMATPSASTSSLLPRERVPVEDTTWDSIFPGLWNVTCGDPCRTPGQLRTDASVAERGAVDAVGGMTTGEERGTQDVERFFLAIAILQFFSLFSTVSPGLVILPLLIVLAITALKDGYEDIKRHQSDRNVNYSQVRVLAGGDWNNINPMEGKSKTFVRGFMPKFTRRPSVRRPKKKRTKKSKMEAEMLARGAPPEVIMSGQEPVDVVQQPPQVVEWDGIEYDDEPEQPMMDSPDGLFHHHSQHHYGEGKRPHWQIIKWEDLKVGDYIKIMDNEQIPADVLICATSEEENVAFIETKNLDGETNLKSRSANPALTHLRTARDCANRRNHFRVDCDRPDTNLYKLDAAVVTEGEQKYPVDIGMMLLRGSVLRNTQWVIGVVLFTGEDTKIVLNSGDTPSKRSKVERQMNPQVFINLGILACMCVALGIADAILEQRYFPLDAPWLFGDTHPSDNPHINGLITWAFALITFQNIVPISLYISIEFVRTIQAMWIYFDQEMYYAKTDKQTLARSWNLTP